MNLHLIHMNIMDTLILQAAPPVNTRPQTLAGLLSLHLLRAYHYWVISAQSEYILVMKFVISLASVIAHSII